MGCVRSIPAPVRSIFHSRCLTSDTERGADERTPTEHGRQKGLIWASGGRAKGDRLLLKLTQGGTGSYTFTKTASLKQAGGSITLSAAGGAVGQILFENDGTT